MFWTRTQPIQGRSTVRSPFELFNRFMGANRMTHLATDFPAFNLWANDDGVVLTSELPGVRMEDLDISVSGRNITVKGKREAPDVGEKASRVRHERAEGGFERTFQLPFTIESGRVEATLKSGILSVVLPRAENEKPRRIAISS